MKLKKKICGFDHSFGKLVSANPQSRFLNFLSATFIFLKHFAGVNFIFGRAEQTLSFGL